MLNGGYYKLDMGGRTLNSETTIAGLYNKVKYAIDHNKPIQLGNYVFGGVHYGTNYANARENSTSITLECVYETVAVVVKVTNANKVTVRRVPTKVIPSVDATIPYNTTQGGTKTLEEEDEMLIGEALANGEAIVGTFVYGAGDDDNFSAMVIPQGTTDDDGAPDDVRIIVADTSGNVYVLKIDGTTVTTLAKHTVPV